MKTHSKFTIVTVIFTLWVLMSYVALPQNSTEEIIAGLEKQRFAAMVNKDFVFLEKINADDLVYCHSSGLVDTKASFIQTLKDGKLAYKVMDAEELRVRVYGKTAIINGIAVAKIISNGQEINTKFRFTDVYVKRKKSWQLVTWQSLKLP